MAEDTEWTTPRFRHSHVAVCVAPPETEVQARHNFELLPHHVRLSYEPLAGEPDAAPILSFRVDSLSAARFIFQMCRVPRELPHGGIAVY